MRIRKNFSSISELEERAFCEGYMYAQKEFDQQISNDVMAERLNRNEYEREMEKRKKKRMGGHVMGALGTAGMLNHAGIGSVIKQAEKEELKTLGDRVLRDVVKEGFRDNPNSLERQTKLLKIGDQGIKNIKERAKLYKWANRGLGLGAAALTAGGLYRINKNANKKMTYEDWLAEKNNQNKN